jgi:hypothetical protein
MCTGSLGWIYLPNKPDLRGWPFHFFIFILAIEVGLEVGGDGRGLGSEVRFTNLAIPCLTPSSP